MCPARAGGRGRAQPGGLRGRPGGHGGTLGVHGGGGGGQAVRAHGGDTGGDTEGLCLFFELFGNHLIYFQEKLQALVWDH